MKIGLTYDELQKMFDQKLQSAVENFQTQRQAAKDGESPEADKMLAEIRKDEISSVRLGVMITTMLEVIAYNNEVISQSISALVNQDGVES